MKLGHWIEYQAQNSKFCAAFLSALDKYQYSSDSQWASVHVGLKSMNI